MRCRLSAAVSLWVKCQSTTEWQAKVHIINFYVVFSKIATCVIITVTLHLCPLCFVYGVKKVSLCSWMYFRLIYNQAWPQSWLLPFSHKRCVSDLSLQSVCSTCCELIHMTTRNHNWTDLLLQQQANTLLVIIMITEMTVHQKMGSVQSRLWRRSQSQLHWTRMGCKPLTLSCFCVSQNTVAPTQKLYHFIFRIIKFPSALS